MSGMFNGVSSFNSDLSKWDTSNCTDMSSMFDGATAMLGSHLPLPKGEKRLAYTGKFIDNFQLKCAAKDWSADKTFAKEKYGPIEDWDVSEVTSFEKLFYGAKDFNSDLSKWDTSNCTNMNSMFHGASSFNSDLSKWDTSNCTNMFQMFSGASSFNSDLSKWDTSKCTDNMDDMFDGATAMSSSHKPKGAS
jgi:surface protein